MGLTIENRQRVATIIRDLGKNFSDLMEVLLLGNAEGDASGDVKSAAPKSTTSVAATSATTSSPSPTARSPVHPTAKASPQQKQPPKKKDPNAPKRNLSSYMLFSQSIRPKITKEHPELSAIDTARLIGEKWNALSDKEKEPFVKQAAKEKERFDKNMQLYNDGKYTAPVPAAATAPPVKTEESNKENKKSEKRKHHQPSSESGKKKSKKSSSSGSSSNK